MTALAHRLGYAVVTAVRDERDNLPRLAASMIAQTLRPEVWLIVDNGSRDGSIELVTELARERAWIRLLSVPPQGDLDRGAPVVRSFTAGLEAVGDVDVVVNVDADVSFEASFFDRLLRAFEDDPQLGLASGSGWEERRGRWRQRHLTGSTVWGATRAYRRACLDAVLPLEELVGWDGIDEIRANALGWRTRVVRDLPFLHHRREGARVGAWRMRVEQGRAAHYMGYRAWYLVVRALFNLLRDRRALGLVWGYGSAAWAREPRVASAEARAYLRAQQHPAKLLARAREALGRPG